MVIMKKVTYNLVIGLLLFCWSERSSATIHGNSVRNVNYLKKTSAPRPIKYFILFHLNIKTTQNCFKRSNKNCKEKFLNQI